MSYIQQRPEVVGETVPQPELDAIKKIVAVGYTAMPEEVQQQYGRIARNSDQLVIDAWANDFDTYPIALD